MCASDSLAYIKGSSGVRRKDIARILELHNRHRARVTPAATNMMKMASILVCVSVNLQSCWHTCIFII